MEVQQPRPINPAMTFDEVSMERSKSLVNALQELKNLRPQLYSAAEYCEKSFLHNDQKQMVLDNLKDYAVRALVNAVDHLGTVGYKLNDLLEQQTYDVSTMELKVTCLNQQLLTCRTYTEKEGLRQQQLLAFMPKHHKHYILPNSVSKKVCFGPIVHTDTRKQHIQARAHLQPSSSPASKTLSWYLESETEPNLYGASYAHVHASNSTDETKISGKTSAVFHLIDNEAIKPLAPQIQSTSGNPASNAIMRSMGFALRDGLEGSKNLKSFRSFDNANRREIVRVPARSKSVLSAFFVKSRTLKLKLRTSKLKAGTASRYLSMASLR